MIEPRPYSDGNDLDAMRRLLVAGREANNGTYYIHTGDLGWWLFYPPLEGDFWNQIYLWDDPLQPGRLLGWALMSPDWIGYDVYIQPDLRGSDTAADMYLWAEQRIASITSAKGEQSYSLWVSSTDEVLVNQCLQRGYRLKNVGVQLMRSLDQPIPDSLLPDGYELRGCRGIAEVELRAKAQYGAFSSSAPFERYLQRFSNFMRSPVYDPALDIVAVAPGGEFGAFCIAWIDSSNRVGLFEPVGTHPDFQRQGLGRAVMQEGLRRMKSRGMESAIVSTGEMNLAAIKLYESLGFQILNRFETYEKDV